jgi:glycosyltransferase involved in cell wall biosynthesis
MAQGRYIAFLDSDDLWLPGKLERQLSHFGDEKTAIVFSDYEKVDPKGRRQGRIVHAPAMVDYRRLLKSNCIGNLTAIYDSEKTGKIFFRHPHREDYVFWLEMLEKGLVARNTNSIEALYRKRIGSWTSRKGRAMRWQWDVYRTWLNLSLSQSIYYFSFYLVKGFLKFVV